MLRDALVRDIVSASAPFDGIQIDFESVPDLDKDNFIAFLSLLKSAAGKKVLSVALPARTSTFDDPYDYGLISGIADRVIVMAYDEHWSGGHPGAIASLDWCAKVASYAMSKIGPEKLVMGIPFYGRAWADMHLSKAYTYSSLASLIAGKKIPVIGRNNEIPFFQYSETVNVRVFFEDSHSILSRTKMYQNESVRNISFWKLGQEDPEVWKYLKIQG
jgi:spore germination protein YaaH